MVSTRERIYLMPNDPKKARIELEVSENTYNEIAHAMAVKNIKLEANAEIVLTKDIMIKNPLDLRLIAMRKDAADIAAKVFRTSDETHDGFVSFVDEVANYIVHGTKTKTETNKPE